jgi:hypothetical protein
MRGGGVSERVEELLQEALVEHADGAPASGQLLRRLQVRHRRRQRGQVAAVACGLTVALCATVVALRGWTNGPEVAFEPAGPVSLAPQPSGPTPVTVEWRSGPLTLPAFPYRPSAPMAGLKPSVAMLSDGVPTLRFDGTGEHLRYLTVSVTTGTPQPNPSRVRPWTVHRQYAIFTPPTPDGEDWSLAWSEGDRTVTIRGGGQVDEEPLLKFANGLVAGKVALVEPFRFATVPANLTPVDVEPSWVTFAHDNAPTGNGAEYRLAVMLQDTMPDASGSRAVTVGKLPGIITTSGHTTILAVPQPNGTAVVIQAPANLAISEAQLLKFAAGITPTSEAVPGKG